ncbi:MAG: aldo/keto reductase [[Clostridium] scindens]
MQKKERLGERAAPGWEEEMYYKQYGNTGLKVSAIGLGTMRYDEEDIKAGRLEKCAEIPLYAFEKGINYWDTAPNYCHDKSEIVTGIALSQIKRSDVYVTSKNHLGTLDVGDHPTKEDFRRRLELSLERLKTDYIDFYHMWYAQPGILKAHGRLVTALEAKKDGLIRIFLFSSHMQGNGDRESGRFRQV